MTPERKAIVEAKLAKFPPEKAAKIRKVLADREAGIKPRFIMTEERRARIKARIAEMPPEKTEKALAALAALEARAVREAAEESREDAVACG